MINLISENIVNELKLGNTIKANVLRNLKSALEVNKKALKKRNEIDVISSYRKMLEKSLDYYVSNETKTNEIKQEILYVAEYLPRQFSKMELVSVIEELKAEIELLGLTVSKGEIIKIFKERFNGKADSAILMSVIDSCLK